ncbi:Ribokinase-like protein [Tuber magnatum]|uniref:Ribokinase-like protein n=1 Tax=Tuber magnatum TaxID=42249 RepID=A0A317SZX9_9PEZI|nr:Ribokinase-like protein [Tuber magnatum]
MDARDSTPQRTVPARNVDFTTFAMFILDEIHFGEDKEDMVSNIIGGAGTFSVIGARVFSPGPQAKSIGWIVDAGNDFPQEVRRELMALGTDLAIREDLERKTTRGWNKYGPGDYREFKYLTPKKRIEVNDLVEEGLFTAKTSHLICTPARASSVCSGLHKALQDRLLHPTPLVIWEPVPDSCNPEHRMEMHTTPPPYKVLEMVHIISPNHDELAGFYGIKDPLEKRDPDTIKSLAGKIAAAGIGQQGSGAIIVRAGKLGCLVACKKHTPIWLPAYHPPTEGGDNNPGVVDPTGGGNAFIGGMSISIARNGSTKFVLAAAMGIVAASFAIEQVGMPKLEVVDGEERWNGVSVRERMEEYRRRVENMGISLDV